MLTTDDKVIVDVYGKNIARLFVQSPDLKILSANIYSSADAYLSLSYSIKLKMMHSSLEDTRAKSIYSSLTSTIALKIIENFDYSLSDFFKFVNKRDVFFNKFASNLLTEENNVETIIDKISEETSFILAYDVTYNEYVEFDEKSSLLVKDVFEQLEIDYAIKSWHTATAKIINEMLEKFENASVDDYQKTNSDAEIKKLYNAFANGDNSVTGNDLYKLARDFRKRANDNHYTSNITQIVVLSFSGDKTKFNGYLICDKNNNIKEFDFLMFEKRTVIVHLDNEDTIYYINCKLITGQKTNVSPEKAQTQFVQKQTTNYSTTHNSSINLSNTNKNKINKYKFLNKFGIIFLVVLFFILLISIMIALLTVDDDSSNNIVTTTNSTKQTITTETTTSYPEVELPKSGKILLPTEESRDSELTIHNSGYNCYVKLKDVNHYDVFGFFVRANDDVTINVPQGHYYVYFASGDTWYGKKHLFGEKTMCSRDKEVKDFENYTYTYTLEKVYNGNFDPETINIEEF